MSMVESSPLIKIGLQKRKRRPPPQNTSILTRSRSRMMHLHQSSYGVRRTDPLQQAFVSVPSKTEALEALSALSCSDASYVGSSIKDLRMRRVFTPVVNSVHGVEDEEGFEEEKRLFNGPHGGSDFGRVIDSPEGDAKADKIEKSEIVIATAEAPRNDVENGLSLKDHAILRNGSNSRSTMVRCNRRKVFKCSSSVSYGRLLPYLMDIQNDVSGDQKFEIVDVRTSCKLTKFGSTDSGGQTINHNESFVRDDHVVLQFNDVKVNDSEFHMEVHKDQQDLNSEENELNRTEKAIRPPHEEQNDQQANAKAVDDSAEDEYGRMTPPDPDILTRAGFGCTDKLMASMAAEVSNVKGFHAVTGKSNRDVLRQSPTAKCGSSSINRSVLAPCSRLRLFKNPRSLSYRRLLPFITEMSKNSSGSTIVPQDAISNVDSNTAEHSVSVPDIAEQNYENKIRKENSCKEQQVAEQLQEPISSLGSLPPSNDYVPSPHTASIVGTSNVQPSGVRSESHHDPSKLSEHEKVIPGSQSAIGHLETGSNRKEDSPALLQFSTVNNDIMTEQFPIEKPVGVLKRKVLLDENNGESMGRLCLARRPFHLEASDAFVPTNVPGPSKGILKRNRHGCRGLCNCLNCASFRLHADKAFEFSWNQMHDSEELASDLMKELANLRLILEKSIIHGKNCDSIQFNQVVKQACNQALETENQAKERLGQLNYDLNVHCRIPALLPPKVTFANYIRERVFPKSDYNGCSDVTNGDGDSLYMHPFDG